MQNIKNFNEKGGLRIIKSHHILVNTLIAGLLLVLIKLITGCGQHDDKSKTNEADLVANVHFVDSVGSNLLFRGASPLTDSGSFNYDGLKKAVKAAGKQAGVKVPDSFCIYDINLLQSENQDDINKIVAEYLFFNKHPEAGKVYFWGIRGTGIEVTCPVYDSSRNFLAKNLDKWLNDRLVERVGKIRCWLENRDSCRTKQPLVIYMHCLGGCDRTGELSGAYYLRYQKKSLEEVHDLCKHLDPACTGIGCNNFRALQWYCLYLNLTPERFKFNLHWWNDFNYDCNGTDKSGCNRCKP